MTAEILTAISNTLRVEPFAVLNAHQRDELRDHVVYIEYMGEVTKMGAFFIPSHAMLFGEHLKKDSPMWKVCVVRSLLGKQLIIEITETRKEVVY